MTDYFKAVKEELEQATSRYGRFNSPHEGYGVILEELDEMWDEIKFDNVPKARQEAVQVAAMAIRFLMDSEKWK